VQQPYSFSQINQLLSNQNHVKHEVDIGIPEKGYSD